MRSRALLVVASSLAVASAFGGFSRERFRDPENIHSPAYFWMWNAQLNPVELNAQLDDMLAHGLRSVCIHPFPKMFRPGIFQSDMEPDYLTDGYFAVFSNVVDHAASLGMNVWLYDEGGWPSGGACGQIAAADKEGRFKNRFLGVGADGKSVKVHVAQYGKGGRTTLPSIIEKGTAEEFIRRTHQQYKKYVGHHFGKAIRFTFMDEPTVPRGARWLCGLSDGIAWSVDFADEFRRRKGYDILPVAAKIIRGANDADGKIAGWRVDYSDVIADLFVERFMDPIRVWCRQNGLLSSGHFDGEDTPEKSSSYGALLRSMRAMDVPGVDVIWRQLFPESDLNPGRQAPFPRYASSVAHQKGERLALSESFGIYGNSLTPDQLKWLVDYQMVRGINLFVFGYYAVSNRQQWMLLFEPHSGPVAPWWDMERPYFDYIARTSSLLAEGAPVTDIAVFFDERAFHAGGSDAEIAGRLHYTAATILDRLNCEYEFVDDDAIAAAEAQNGRLRIGPMAYSMLVLPTAKWMRPDAKARVDEFKKSGGTVLTVEMLDRARPVCRVKGPQAADLRFAKRVKDGETLYFVVNESGRRFSVLLDFDEKGDVVRADPESGDFVAVNRQEDGVRWLFEPFGSVAFVVGAKADRAPPPQFFSRREFKNGWTVRRLVSHALGEEDFVVTPVDEKPVPASLGDWRGLFGCSFSGKACYRLAFKCARKEPALLDLGKVGWTCSVRLNGQELPAKFFGPFRWNVETREGENVLEVTVANTLANAVMDMKARAKVTAKYPPGPTYDPKQRAFDRENNESGLFGPVILHTRK